MASAKDLDIALYVFFAVFLTVACVCYSWEVWHRTEWRTLRKQLLTLPTTIRDWIKALRCPKPGDSTSNGKQQAPATDVEKSRKGHDTPRKESSEDWKLRWATSIPCIVWAFSVVVPLWPLSDTTSSDHDLLRKSTARWNASVLSPDGSNTTALDVNADIAGHGIRAGLYIPVILALLTLSIGFLHREDTGAKEIGGAQLLSTRDFFSHVHVFVLTICVALFYLNLNAFKAATAGFKDLTFPDIVLACMTMDFTAAGLQMTTSGKETLAARWFVGISALNQVFASVMVVAMLTRIKHNFMGLSEAEIVWWSRINSRTGPSKAVWIYITVRCLILAHGLWLDARYSPPFHILQKDWSSIAGADQEMERAKEKEEEEERLTMEKGKQLWPRMKAEQYRQQEVKASELHLYEYQYAVLPATAFSKWIEWLPSLLVAVVSMETLVTRLDYRSDINEWGQSAALVLAIAGVMHWCYVSGQVIRGKKEETCFYHWLREAVRHLRISDPWKRHPINYPRYSNRYSEGTDISDKSLLEAAEENDITAVRKLLRHGAYIDTVEQEKEMTTLLYAICYGNLDSVRELMRAGASWDLPHTLPGFLVAAREGRERVLRYLLQKWHDQFQRDLMVSIISHSHPTSEAGANTMNPWKPDGAGRTPLYTAAEAKQYSAVRTLIEYLCPRGETSTGYFEAIKKAGAERCDAALICLLECGTNTLYLHSEGPKGSTILHDAVRRTHTAKAQSLKADSKQQADILESQEAAQDHLEYLAKIFDESRIFDETKASVDVPDALGRTPLSIAMRSDANDACNDQAAKVLLQFGADAFAEDHQRESPFSRFVQSIVQTSDAKLLTTTSSRLLHIKYPFLDALLPVPASHDDDDTTMVISDRLCVGLLDLPANVLYWLGKRGHIDPLSPVGANRCPLIVRAISADKVAPVVALFATHDHYGWDREISNPIVRWRRGQPGANESTRVDMATAEALDSLWDKTVKERIQCMKTIIDGGLELHDGGPTSIVPYILTNAKEYFARTNIDEFYETPKGKIRAPKPSWQPVRIVEKGVLQSKAEHTLHMLRKGLRDQY